VDRYQRIAGRLKSSRFVVSEKTKVTKPKTVTKQNLQPECPERWPFYAVLPFELGYHSIISSVWTVAILHWQLATVDSSGLAQLGAVPSRHATSSTGSRSSVRVAWVDLTVTRWQVECQ
jgi:hypothetical protein